MEKRIYIALAASFVVGAAAGLAWWQWPATPLVPPPELETSLLPEPRSVAGFSLRDHRGAEFDESRFRGKWSVVFFGYTHCPDVCPTALMTLASTAKQLEQAQIPPNDTQFVFISVDPRRDSPEQLASYIAYFHPAFIGATGESAQIDGLVRQFGAVYMFDGDTSGDNYVVNHSATIFVVDPEGRYVARISPPHTPAQVTDTLQRIRRFFQH